MSKTSRNSREPKACKVGVRPFSDAVAFHGHVCPGLILGYLAAVRAMEELECGRSEDEELAAGHRARLKDGAIVCITCAGEYSRGW